MESLSISILNKKCKNIINNTIFKLANGDIETCKNYFKNLFTKNDIVNKNINLAGDFSLNVLGFEDNKNAQNFINPVFRRSKPTQVTVKTATVINRITINVMIDTDFNTEIFNSCIFDIFAFMLTFQIVEKKVCNK